jgi:hypothetical protein
MIVFLSQCVLSLAIFSVVLVSIAVIAIMAWLALVSFADLIGYAFKVLGARFIRSN